MRKFFFFFATICFFCFYGYSQASRQTTGGSITDTIWGHPIKEAFENVHWITRPSGNTVTVVGIAGRKARRDEAIADALADAARRVSLYYGVYGETDTLLQDGTNLLDYYAGTEYRLDIKNEANSFTDKLIFDKEKDVFEKNGAVYVRVRYTGIKEVPAYKSGTSGGTPDWVRNYKAEIPGYMAGIGVSKNKGSPQKTYIASYENALVSLLAQISNTTEESTLDIQGQGRITRIISKSRGTLSEVVILETWFNPKTGEVWTLLAAKPSAR